MKYTLLSLCLFFCSCCIAQSIVPGFSFHSNTIFSFYNTWVQIPGNDFYSLDLNGEAITLSLDLRSAHPPAACRNIHHTHTSKQALGNVRAWL